MLNRNASINLRTIDGHTALTFAVNRKSKELVELLIARGADVPSDYSEELALTIVRAYLNRHDVESAERAVNIGCQQCPSLANDLHHELARHYQKQWAADGNPDYIEKALEHALKISLDKNKLNGATKEYWTIAQQEVAEYYFTQNPNNPVDFQSLSDNISRILELSATAPELALAGMKEILRCRR